MDQFRARCAYNVPRHSGRQSSCLDGNVVTSRENGAKRITRGVTLTCDIQSRAPSFIMHPTTYKTKAYSAASATSPLASTIIPRREPTEHDVQIEILFCGICHSDLHQVRNEWSGVMPTVYPIVPGHEIVGRVTKVGSDVTKYKPGRPRRGRLPGRFGPHLPKLQSGP